MKRNKSEADEPATEWDSWDRATRYARGTNLSWQMSHEKEFKWNKRTVLRSGCAAANDQALLDKLADLANISEDQLEEFRVGVGLQIADLWRSHNEAHLRRPERTSKNLKVRLQQVTTHCLKAKEALLRLDDPGVRQVMSAAVGVEMFHQKIDDIPRVPDRDRDFVSLVRSLDHIVEVCDNALDIARIKVPAMPRGRPAGLSPFVEFILYLLWEARAAGGRFTFDKNRGTGTLPRALDLLRPHLPAGFIKNALPRSTLATAKALDSKIVDVWGTH